MNPATEKSTFTATVDGKAIGSAVVLANVAENLPGFITIAASWAVGDTVSTISIDLQDLAGVGIYGLGGQNGNLAMLIDVMKGGTQANAWQSAFDHPTGEVSVKVLTASRIAGTFQFTAEPAMDNPVGGTRVVTNGQFDSLLNKVRTN